jgi:hypothetical protein
MFSKAGGASRQHERILAGHLVEEARERRPRRRDETFLRGIALHLGERDAERGVGVGVDGLALARAERLESRDRVGLHGEELSGPRARLAPLGEEIPGERDGERQIRVARGVQIFGFRVQIA